MYPTSPTAITATVTTISTAGARDSLSFSSHRTTGVNRKLKSIASASGTSTSRAKKSAATTTQSEAMMSNREFLFCSTLRAIEDPRPYTYGGYPIACLADDSTTGANKAMAKSDGNGQVTHL